MRIAIYKDTLSAKRGADMAVCSLEDGLSERGHEVVLMTDDDSGGDVCGRLCGFDVCVAAGANEILTLTRNGTARPPIRTLLQFHTHPSHPFRHWIRRWCRCRAIRRAIALADAVQVLLPSHEAALHHEVPSLSSPVFVIGNTSRFAESETTADEKPVIIYPGALNEDKNQMLLVESFARVASDFPDWSVILYGTGRKSYEKRLRLRIASLNMEGRVSLAGYCNDLERQYASCAFVAFPSRNEGFPLTIADAAAFAKPVVGLADTPSVAEIVEDGVTGLLSASTANAYATCLARLMEDATLRKSIGCAARDTFASMYSRSSLLDRWESAITAVRSKT